MLSCGSSETKQENNLTASETADKVRAHWEKIRKPFVVSLDKQYELPNIGFIAKLSDATQQEVESLSNVNFKNIKNNFSSYNHEAMTSDSTAKVMICYPYRKNMNSDGTTILSAPFADNLYGDELFRSFGDSIMIKMKMKSSMAVIRIILESYDVRDMLEELRISGSEIFTSGKYCPYTGDWLTKIQGEYLKATTTDCLLNNGRNHDIYMIPTEKSGEMAVIAKVNHKSYSVKTKLPHLSAGSMLQLNIRKNKEGLSIISSWVENDRPYNPSTINIVDTVKVGHFLQKQGYISAVRDTNSVAYIIQTDGRHGKAVALNDCKGRFCFSTQKATSRKYFPTVDGKRKEGLINPSITDGMNIENVIIYKPKMPFPETSALGYISGDKLTSYLLSSMENIKSSMGITPKADMLSEMRRHSGSYIPSLAEMTQWYYQLHPIGEKSIIPTGYDIPKGEYITSTEQTDKTAYMIDFTQGIIAGGLSKQYASLQLRLFYLF